MEGRVVPEAFRKKKEKRKKNNEGKRSLVGKVSQPLLKHFVCLFVGRASLEASAVHDDKHGNRRA